MSGASIRNPFVLAAALSVLAVPLRAAKSERSSAGTIVVLPGDERLDGKRLVPHRATWRVTVHGTDGSSRVQGLWTDVWVRSEEDGRPVVILRSLSVDTLGHVLADDETVFDATSFRPLRSTQSAPPSGGRVSYRYEGDSVSGTLRQSATAAPRQFEVEFDEPVWEPLAPMLLLFPFEELAPGTVLRYPIWNQGPGDDVTWRSFRIGSAKTVRAPDGSEIVAWSHTTMDAAAEVVYRALRTPEPPYWWWLRSERPGVT
ncbi:MAG: hypothetical protein ACREQY_07730, partial [Candidatus Binatia bacterium]